MSRQGPASVSAGDIATALRGLIAQEAYGPGGRLPSENALVEQYAVSRVTVRAALAMLQQQGLTVSRRGSGVFVRPTRPLRRHGMQRYARSRWRTAVLGAEADQQGIKARRSIHRLATVPAPDRVAQRLGITPGEGVWTRQRIVFLEDQPTQTADSYYPLDVVEGTGLRETDPGPSDFAQLDDAGHTPTRIREEWQARMPTPEETTTLDLMPGTPVLDFTRTITDQNNRAVEVMLSLIAADSTQMDYEFPIPPN